MHSLHVDMESQSGPKCDMSNSYVPEIQHAYLFPNIFCSNWHICLAHHLYSTSGSNSRTAAVNPYATNNMYISITYISYIKIQIGIKLTFCISDINVKLDPSPNSREFFNKPMNHFQLKVFSFWVIAKASGYIESSASIPIAVSSIPLAYPLKNVPSTPIKGRQPALHPCYSDEDNGVSKPLKTYAVYLSTTICSITFAYGVSKRLKTYRELQPKYNLTYLVLLGFSKHNLRLITTVH